MADDSGATDPQLRELALLLHDLSWRVARFGPSQVGVQPLPASELAILRAVMDQPGRSVSDVAVLLSMQTSNVSAAVRSLTERGLMEKRAAATDRRMTLLYPTRRALGERDRIEQAAAAVVADALATLSPRDLRALQAAQPAVRALCDAVAKVPHSAPAP
jgi:DNA-binding MarR family transcriptional regulator